VFLGEARLAFFKANLVFLDDFEGFGAEMTPISTSAPQAEPHPNAEMARLRHENQVLRELLDLFEHYCEFRLGVKGAIQAKDIPNLRDINKARKLLGYQEISLKGGSHG
jgi:hypothetical protein